MDRTAILPGKTRIPQNLFSAYRTTMSHRPTSHRWLAVPLIVLALGCAPAYRSYPGCHVDCRYCPPPALPFVHYDECVCHSCAASEYLVRPTQTIDE